MSDTNSATTSTPRVKASERQLFLADGTDGTYTDSIRAVYKIPANGYAVEYVFGQNPVMDKAFAFFGFHTKIGNVANTVRNDKSNPGTPDDEGEAIEEFFASLASGAWREPSEARGPKYDDDVLAHVIHAAFERLGIAKGDVAHYRAKLTDKAYRAKVLAGAVGDQTVKDLYAAEAAARGIAKAPAPKAIDDLA